MLHVGGNATEFGRNVYFWYLFNLIYKICDILFDNKSKKIIMRALD